MDALGPGAAMPLGHREHRRMKHEVGTAERDPRTNPLAREGASVEVGV